MSGLWTEFDGAFFGTCTFYNVGCGPDGKPNPGETPLYAYESHVDSSRQAQAIWGASVEYRTVERCTDGRDWAISKAYGDRNLGMTWAVECVRAECANVVTGEFLDLTKLLPAGPSGAPFCPNAVPDSGEWMFRQWGWIWTDAKQTGAPRRDHPYFWQANLQYGQTVENPSWTGSGPNNVLSVIMREAWWEPGKGWVRGQGTALPWVNGAVADPGIVSYRGWQAWGRGRGVLWAYRYDDYNTALAYFTVASPPPTPEPTVAKTLDDVCALLTEIRDELKAAPPPGPTGPTGATVPPPTPTGPTVTPPPAGVGGTLSPGPDGIYEIPWVSTTSATRHRVPLKCGETSSIRFTTGAATPRNGNIALVEYVDPRQQRLATISTAPGDLSGTVKAGSSINWDYAVGGTQQQWVLLLQPFTTYYINIKTTSGAAGASATMSLDLYVPT